MKEIITTLEDLKDLAELIKSEADMIMVSLDGLSSSAAQKLTLEELDEAIAEITSSQKQIAVLANLTLHEDLLDEVEATMGLLSKRDVSAIFFADPALYMMAKKFGITDRLVYDPETLMTSINDGTWWLERGIRGVSVSPLLTLEETKEICAGVEKAVVTIHGRTLMSRSYRKLLAAYKEKYGLETELEMNKDLRLIEAKRTESMPVYEDETGTLIYSDDVLDSFDFIKQLLESDPMSLLITGSYLTIQEQVEAVRAYRRILNGEDPSAVGKEYRELFKDSQLDSGYYEQKTVR